VTREEFAALLADICGLRLRPDERETILLAADHYAAAEARRIGCRQRELADVPANGDEE
jgi:hypothetical protein